MTKEELIGIIKNKKSAPFLFLGSGFNNSLKIRHA